MRACRPESMPQKGPGQARKQHEQQQREWQRLQQQCTRARSQVPRRGVPIAGVHTHQRHGREKGTTGEPWQLQQALVAQQRRVQQEPRNESEDRHVARRARLEQFRRDHQHQECRAGFDAIQGPVGAEHARGREERNAEPHAASWQWPVPEIRGPPPCANGRKQQCDPGRYVWHVRHDGHDQRGQHPAKPMHSSAARLRHGRWLPRRRTARVHSGSAADVRRRHSFRSSAPASAGRKPRRRRARR